MPGPLRNRLTEGEANFAFDGKEGGLETSQEGGVLWAYWAVRAMVDMEQCDPACHPGILGAREEFKHPRGRQGFKG